MNTKFVYTFKTRRAVLNHLRALAQLSTSFQHSDLPLFDFRIEYSRIFDYLSYLKRGWRKSLYFGFRAHGFEFDDWSFLFDARMNVFQDCMASYVLTYSDGYYELREYSK